MTAETRQLTDELHAANQALQATNERLDRVLGVVGDERRRSRRHRAGSAILAIVVAAVIVLSVRDAQERERAEERQCLAGNATRADIRAAIVDSVLVIVERTENPTRLTPMVAEIQDRLAVTIPDRPC